MGCVDIVRHPRARRTRLSVDPASGRVRLTLPPRVSEAAGLRWAEAHRGWIEDQQARLPRPQPFVPGEQIPFDDARLTIAWQADVPRRVIRSGTALIVGGPIDGVNRRVAAWLKRQALAILRAETDEFAAAAGVTVTGVSVGDPRGRWGSCSSSGAIRYSWRLVLAPAWVRRATVAHEVAHRVHMNHGPAFHALVATLYQADPTPARHWLRREGAALHWFGRGC
ncbi:MAG: M48 family metallopeptidase [Sphingomonas sp.]|nr:M48 family metallopeptidase [Sphingomonas sp.]